MNIIITGASRGIGYDTALQLAAEPGHQILVLSRNQEKLKKLKTEADRFGHQNLQYLAYDLTQAQQSLLLEKVKIWKSVDVLINNAGLLISKPFQILTS